MAGQPGQPAMLRLGPYELLQKLATGGMAEIYVARRVGPHGFSKRIALKRILPQLAADAEFVAMFIDEARVCAQLAHPNLVQVFDFGEQGRELYMAMELVDGTNAAKVVRAAASRGETVPLEVSLHIALSLCRGLEYAHEAMDEQGNPLGLVHRDVSPGNILMSRSGAVKLSDFGIARAAEFDRRTDVGQLKGKLGYMSPEQVTGAELDDKSDQFTAGIVLAELLTARPLFGGHGEMEVLVKIRDADLSSFERNSSALPDDLRAVVLRALSKSPRDRYGTTGKLADALEEIIRRRRLTVGAARLATWLERVGLIKATARSGEHAIDALADTSPGRASVAPRARMDRKHEAGPRVSMQQPVSARRARNMTPDGAPPPSVTAGTVSPAIYRLLLPDGMVGPLSYPRVAELFATGRAFSFTPISREGSGFRPAREHPEFEPICASVSNSWEDSVVSTARRPLQLGDLPGELFDWVARRATGLLLVRDEHRQKKVFFSDGLPQFTASTDPRELLGSFVIARGLALPMEVEMALALAPRHGGRLGDALLGLGVMRPMDLLRAIVEQGRERFVELASWKAGEFSFAEGTTCREDEMIPDMCHPLECIVRGVLAGYSAEEFSFLLDPLQDALVVPVARPTLALSALRLPPAETAVLESIEGGADVAEVTLRSIAKGMATRDEVNRALFLGLSARLIVSPSWPVQEQRASLPTIPAP